MSDIWRSKRNMLVVVILLLLVHSVFIYIWNKKEVTHSSAVIKGERGIAALQISKSEIIWATADNKLLVVHEGSPIKERRLDETITAIAVSEDGNKVYVGTSARNLRIYDKQLTEIGQFAVNGRIKAIDRQGDRLLISYGIGQYNDKQWIGSYTETGEEMFNARIGFDVTAMDAAEAGVLFGTEDAEIGMLDASGNERWRRTLNYPVSSIQFEGQTFLAGDNRGNIYRFDHEGIILWSKSISSYPIKAVYGLQDSQHVLAGDESGNLYLLNGDGKKLYQNRLAGGNQTIGLGVAAADEGSVYSAAGERMAIDLNAADGNN
ncbi:outer membrane protein assembly factor BamB family protein, partial [Paenibacillus agaridevorans]|uniref:outer membrane protein assembly factor BamB family protein n=1 Tax=Paenibacillus agaridevorans TaxID=171404 RepID=UPI001C636C83